MTATAGVVAGGIAVQSPCPASPPPFDLLLLRILSAPPSTTASSSSSSSPSSHTADTLQSALHQLSSFSSSSSSHPSLLSPFCSHLVQPRVVLLSDGRLSCRCHLLLLPPHTQRTVLCFLLATLLPNHSRRFIPRSYDTSGGAVWRLLDEYGAQLLEERRQAATSRGISGWAVLLPVAECDALLLILRSLYTRCRRPLPPPPLLAPVVMPLLQQNNQHLTSLAASSSVSAASSNTVVDDCGAAPHAEQPFVVYTAPLVAMLMSMWQSNGGGGELEVENRMMDRRKEQDDGDWMMQWEVDEDTAAAASRVVGELCAFDDDCFVSPVQAEEDKAQHSEKGGKLDIKDREERKEVQQQSAPRTTEIETLHTPAAASLSPLSVAADLHGTAVASMQSLLSALTALRLHDLVGIFPTGSKSAISDEQLRRHAALSNIIPLVDAVHALPSSAALEMCFSRPTAESLNPAALPVELFYVFVRVLLTAAVGQQRAIVILQHAMRHLLDLADMSSYSRYTEEALIHAVTVHPHAVYQTLLSTLVTPAAINTLQPHHAKLIQVCVKQNTARLDLSQQLVIDIADSITANAQLAFNNATINPAPVMPSVAAIGLLVDLQSDSDSPLSPLVIAAELSLLCTLAASPSFASQDKQWMSRVSSLLKRLMTDGGGMAACRVRKAELLLGWGKLKALKSKYLLAALQAEKLEKL